MMILYSGNFSETEQPNVTTTVEPPFQGDESKYLIVPLVVIVLVMLLSLLVYCMAKRRSMNKLRRDIALLYKYDENDLEQEALNSFERSFYGTSDFSPALQNDNYMPTTNL